jgi:phosphatidylglycerophosphate synthase
MTFSDFWSQRFATTGQYFFTRVISQRIGAAFAYAAYRLELSPNAVTLIGLGVMLSASLCLALAPAHPGAMWAALMLYQAGFGLDCADGQLARATQRTSKFGAWLDIATDHVRQVSILIALGVNLLGHGAPPSVVLLALFVLGSGLTVSLHTVAVLKAGAFKQHELAGAGALVKQLIKEVTDTPLFLMALCLLQSVPALLLLYLFGVGALCLAQSVALAWLRVRMETAP